MKLWNNGLLIIAPDSQDGDPEFKTAGSLQGQLSLSYPCGVYQLSTRNFGKLNGKSKLSPQSGSVALRKLNLIHEKGP